MSLASFNALHSTMFLLIRRGAAVRPQRQVALHSTMFLLIRVRREQLRRIRNFTFHNVSINTVLHYKRGKAVFELYIPQCFY